AVENPAHQPDGDQQERRQGENGGVGERGAQAVGAVPPPLVHAGADGGAMPPSPATAASQAPGFSPRPSSTSGSRAAIGLINAPSTSAAPALRTRPDFRTSALRGRRPPSMSIGERSVPMLKSFGC